MALWNECGVNARLLGKYAEVEQDLALLPQPRPECWRRMGTGSCYISGACPTPVGSILSAPARMQFLLVKLIQKLCFLKFVSGQAHACSERNGPIWLAS